MFTDKLNKSIPTKLLVSFAACYFKGVIFQKKKKKFLLNVTLKQNWKLQYIQQLLKKKIVNGKHFCLYYRTFHYSSGNEQHKWKEFKEICKKKV